MSHYLEGFAPNGRDNCLCGSGDRFKSCCKDQWQKHDFRFSGVASESFIQKLKRNRAHITWYRLCHLAHTAPIVGTAEGDKLLDVDLAALFELVRNVYFLYRECDVVEKYPPMLHEMSAAISDDRWLWMLCSEEALFYMVVHDNYSAARKILGKYNWHEVCVSEFLEVYLDAFSSQLSHLETIQLASKIVVVAKNDSVRFHYKFLVAMQHFLMNEIESAERLGGEAVSEYENVPVERRTAHGRMSLARAYKQLGEVSGDALKLKRAAELFVLETDRSEYRDVAIANIWCKVGECYFSMGELYLAEKCYCRSISIDKAPLPMIYLAKVQLSLGRIDRAVSLLDEVAPMDMSAVNWFDYVMVRCDLSSRTKKADDISSSLAMLKKISVKDPYFKDLIRDLLVALYESPRARDDSRMTLILTKINKYVSISPNVAGIGFNVNAMIEDFLAARKKG
jgi:tetratricopeptide (TPR) repeat protein